KQSSLLQQTGLLRRYAPRNDGEKPQFSSLVSSGACGGVLMAIAFSGALVPPCAVPLGMTTRSPGFTVTCLSPSQIVPVPSRMYCISLVFGCMCLGTMPFCTETVAPSAETNIFDRVPPALAWPSASSFNSPV